MPDDDGKFDRAYKFISKAYDTYREFEDAKDDEEDKIMETLNKIPLYRVVGPDEDDPVRIRSFLIYFMV